MESVDLSGDGTGRDGQKEFDTPRESQSPERKCHTRFAIRLPGDAIVQFRSIVHSPRHTTWLNRPLPAAERWSCEVLALRRRRSASPPPARVLVRHVFPHLSETAAVLVVLDILHAILSESLSFLGLGIRPSLLAGARS